MLHNRIYNDVFNVDDAAIVQLYVFVFTRVLYLCENTVTFNYWFEC